MSEQQQASVSGTALSERDAVGGAVLLCQNKVTGKVAARRRG